MACVDLVSLEKQLQVYCDVDSGVFVSLQRQFRRLKCKSCLENGDCDAFYAFVFSTLLDIHADQKTIFAAIILCYGIEDTWSDIVGSTPASLVLGVRHLMAYEFEALTSGSERHEVVRKMLVSLSDDLRVVLLYLVLQLARLQVPKDLSIAHLVSQRQLAAVILHIFVPVAGRFGLYRLKRLLEDACFQYLYPSEFEVLKLSYSKRFEISDAYFERLISKISSFLTDHDVVAEVSGRVKGMYSTYSKMKRYASYQLLDIYDLLAFRVVVADVSECYKVMGLFNSSFSSVEERFKDYIAYPKINGYQSLHLVVHGLIEEDLAVPVEIQIRTHEMHEEAEYGIASHWWYEEQGIKQRSAFVKEQGVHERVSDKYDWVGNLLRVHERLSDSKRAYDIDFFSDRIFVLTISNEVLDLPRGSTPVDLAYAISKEMGDHCFKAKVNGRTVSLDYELESGDKVFIVQKLQAVPSIFWLSFVCTQRAKDSIKLWLQDHDGLDEQEKRPTGIQPLEVPDKKPVSGRSVSDRRLLVHGYTDLDTRLASCCAPLPGVSLLGYVTRGGFISVHRKDCRALHALDRRRYIEVSWAQEKV
jgi:(p)ppGpp synthase/HD superfamily hydrolase